MSEGKNEVVFHTNHGTVTVVTPHDLWMESHRRWCEKKGEKMRGYAVDGIKYNCNDWVFRHVATRFALLNEQDMLVGRYKDMAGAIKDETTYAKHDGHEVSVVAKISVNADYDLCFLTSPEDWYFTFAPGRGMEVEPLPGKAPYVFMVRKERPEALDSVRAVLKVNGVEVGWAESVKLLPSVLGADHEKVVMKQNMSGGATGGMSGTSVQPGGIAAGGAGGAGGYAGSSGCGGAVPIKVNYTYLDKPVGEVPAELPEMRPMTDDERCKKTCPTIMNGHFPDCPYYKDQP